MGQTSDGSMQYLSFFLVGSEWHGSALASMQGLCLIVQGKATMYMMKLLGISFDNILFLFFFGYYYTNSSGYYYDPSTGLFWLHPQDSEVGASYTPTLISIISLHSILAMNELICTHLPYTDLFRGRICSSSIGVARKHNLILGTEMFRGLGL
ncbi:uncharacterized protein LOC141648040 isoform X3 [Silene latifolia]|uniref:uncharacterized protein LOC141648040 isoform X3 n=1 Tax=Silene latifolia TaxID=37657 RepID=UPI003D7704C5